ncbi:methyltransferase domain-containing protein [Desulfohalovibrio reitneri]|uniref:methyltransferase domain-containing protein n=1 Tax=Desulfohalovibrio reitneri TaxID=1307759 RepID=UPI00068D720F|nr:methyltransferase domain-containing protein [Desulfohalovibrio reitneri]
MNPLGKAAWWAKGRLCLALKKRGFFKPDYTKADQSKDRVAPFDEYPACDFCGAEESTERLVTGDGGRIAACDGCGLWFTTPRIAEDVWEDYLLAETPRSVEFTENRLKYGVALSSNIKFSLPGWKEKWLRSFGALLDDLERVHGGPLERLHDVGAGVGLFMEAARKRGIRVSGNELNGYAVRAMRERLGLDVSGAPLPRMDIEPRSLDAVTMCDYLEHSYHPYRDLLAAHRALRPGGVLYVNTFHTGCRAFEELGANWNFLYWNHTHHFDRDILTRMVQAAGFAPVETRCEHGNPLISLFAVREAD